jgi:phospho-N-acetylmuramoyl-pentapeptide-transferase
MFFPTRYTAFIAFAGIVFAFAVTIVAMQLLNRYLPKDAGRQFAHDGKLSIGKPRGAGILFVPVFCLCAMLFAPIDVEMAIYLILLLIIMMTGFLDDASSTPWGELKKGFLDLCVAGMVAYTYLRFHPPTLTLTIWDTQVTLPPLVFALGIMVLVWISVNVTNCADGVDGLSGTLTLISIMSVYMILRSMEGEALLAADFLEQPHLYSYSILLFAVCILGYLWYNATPSRLMMGDAGSRSMGLFISIVILRTNDPFLYLLIAFVLLMDGGLGLGKVFLIRCFRIRILKSVRTPLHDHVRKVWNWSNTQTVFRFAIIQILISMAGIALMNRTG